ncbi:hypothetical protein Mesau_02685 [Mesorhizobium australicum WSM2073]|uniref:Uncharacterized protein n=3 Tax=Mesorhizobium TaxID=68287 RepID=L0KID3_MESAW|nr:MULTISPECIES: hypothetical protein [Mesorhizobium]ADV11703.1 hypothetical protein Mesci_2564 [Mesorhizobium ciceri biovar biserrulae WSM1271]AEH87208.1 hypothetical protein Mesop_2744 [Mesorhizobium opportunistum WSM2075]AGB45102.1 hypothetical protein Mesau_02685 [Mesorhizobium australicum WSM2073]OBP89546.1 hypothetical protein BAE40_19460 [Mesorhizobium loti]
MVAQAKFSAKSMFEELDKGPQYVLTGMVKLHATDSTRLLFSEVGDCQHWTEIDEKLISRFENHGLATCGDHRHPIVSLHLVHPNNPEAKVYARAQAQTAAFSTRALDAIPSGDTGPETDCYYDRKSHMWRKISDNTPCPRR